MIRKATLGWTALAALALAAPALADVGLSTANLAPQDAGSGGTATIEVDGIVRADGLPYKGFGNGFRVRAGEVLAVARGSDGAELARRTLALEDRVEYVLLLTGNGVDAPYELRLAVDHNHPLHGDEFTTQDVHAAPIAGEDGELRALGTRLFCGGGRIDTNSFVYGDGTLENGRSYHISRRGIVNDDVPPCTLSVTEIGSPLPLAELTFRREVGARYRFFIVGDGIRQPLEALGWLQRHEPTVASQTPDPGIEGLWFDPANPGVGVSIVFDADAPERQRVNAILYGFDAEGRATWNFVSAGRGLDRGVEVYEYAGGNPSGTRSTVRYQLADSGTLEFHSCTEATLKLRLPQEIEFPQRTAFGTRYVPPRDAVRLVRLLPAGSQCATSASFG